MSLTMPPLTTINDGRTPANPFVPPPAVAVTAANELVRASGLATTPNVTGSAAVIKAGAGRLAKVVVNASPSAATTFNDAATVAGAAAGNLLFTIPSGAAVGTVYDLDIPFTAGLVATPGTGGVFAVVWS